MFEPDLAVEIATTEATILSNIEQTPPASAEPELVELFARLTRATAPLEQAETEDRIWAVWMRHARADLDQQMNAAVAAMAARDNDRGEQLLNAVLARAPAWAEAWNKRATLRFLAGRARESVLDIRKTLELEPRHFGALAGLGQICLRAGDHESARIAFQAALRSNPHLASISQMLRALETQAPRTMH